MKKQGFFHEIISPAIVLTVIALVVTAALAFTNALTAPIIEANSQGAAGEARKVLLPDADKFVSLDVTDEYMANFGCVDIYDAKNGAGTVVTVQAQGYGGSFTMMVAFKPDGTVAGIEPVVHEETAGLGENAFKSPFKDQFVGKTAAGLTVVKGAASGENEISAVTGATISSKAVTLGVNNAYEIFKAVKGVK